MLQCKLDEVSNLIRDIVQQGDVTVTKIATTDNLADPFTKALPSKVFDSHLDRLGLRCNPSWLWLQVGVFWIVTLNQ